jgi:hypothetical protein
MGYYVAVSFHPHLHCVVTGGGLSPDGSRWVAARPGYLLPVKVLGRLFRGKFLAGVQEAYTRLERQTPEAFCTLPANERG